MQIGLLIFIMIGLLWIANQLFLSPYYISKVKNQLIDDYDTINQLFEYDSDSSLEILSSLESDTQMDLLIIDRASTLLYQTSGSDYNRRFIDQMNNTTPNSPMPAPPNTMDGITFDGGIRLPNPIGDISKIEDIDGNLRYLWLDDPLFSGRNLILTGLLDNNAIVFLRVPLATIETGIASSNQFLLFIGGGIFILGMIMAYMMAKSFTKPITTISRITKNMKQLDFNEYCPVTSNDELGKLAENINELSLALSGNIEQLNHEIHEKNLVNEKRKELLNNVSHELKTPLALMQGYAEGLKLNVANSSNKKDFYCDVIIDETKKMNGLVHQLLNINQLEFGHNVLNY
jgi:two-component system sensor histidine kinase VanS